MTHTFKDLSIKQKILIAILTPVLLFGILVLYYYVTFFESRIRLPVEQFEISKQYPWQLTKQEKEDLSKIRYELVSLEQVPQFCVNAIVAIEDKNFWTNNGVDKNGLGRLALSILPGSNIVSGGSTISQQVIKMSTNRFYNRNPLDKLKEIVWAIRLNDSLSKGEILERYLNNLYFGDYNYGIGEASKEYFSKSVSDLTLQECSYLMGIPQFPNVYKPTNGISPEAGKQRQYFVLEQMYKEEYITEIEFRESLLSM